MLCKRLELFADWIGRKEEQEHKIDRPADDRFKIYRLETGGRSTGEAHGPGGLFQKAQARRITGEIDGLSRYYSAGFR